MMTYSTEPLRNRPTTSALKFTHEGYAPISARDLRADKLRGATVYGHGEDKVGTISSLKVTPERRVTGVVLDVGGFFGIGAHSVVMSIEKLTVLRKNHGEAIRVYADTTKKKLKQMPAHDA